jgi:hypothetical protein
MTVPRSCLSSSGMVTGISPKAAVLPSRVRCQAAAAARKAAASRLIAVQRCQEVHVVTWPLSRPAACLLSW